MKQTRCCRREKQKNKNREKPLFVFVCCVVVIHLNNLLGPADDTVTAQKCSTKH